jgi:uncharacterized protein
MESEWDEEKDAQNRAKHCVGLGDAARMDWAGGRTEPDLRTDHGEERFRLVSPIGGRQHLCVFTFRDGRIRIISVRKINAREARRYGAPDTAR